VVFCQGCPWRCGYCHNPHLISRESDIGMDWSTVKNFLARRQGLLDAVVFSGGEPTLYDLGPAIREVRRLGFKVGLHTGGCYPERLRPLLPLLDWVGMDFKALPRDYVGVTGVPGSGDKALESLELLLASGVPNEIRTTVHPLLHTAESLRELAETLAGLGVRNYVLQQFRPQGCAEETLRARAASQPGVEALRLGLATLFQRFDVRPA
jgi:pyruvate formate lyase activating enzyme